MENEDYELPKEQATDRLFALREIEASWEKQLRRPSPEEIDAWITKRDP